MLKDYTCQWAEIFFKIRQNCTKFNYHYEFDTALSKVFENLFIYLYQNC